MRFLVTLAAVAALAFSARAEDAPAAPTKFYLVDGKVEAAEKRIADLEKRVAELEKQAAGAKTPGAARENVWETVHGTLVGAQLARGPYGASDLYLTYKLTADGYVVGKWFQGTDVFGNFDGDRGLHRAAEIVTWVRAHPGASFGGKFGYGWVLDFTSAATGPAAKSAAKPCTCAGCACASGKPCACPKCTCPDCPGLVEPAAAEPAAATDVWTVNGVRYRLPKGQLPPLPPGWSWSPAAPTFGAPACSGPFCVGAK